MKKQKLLIILIALFLPIFNLSAQIFENVPGQESADGDLIKYLDNLYKFGIAITGILAVFMIALGAFSYIVTSAGNSSKMMSAKEMINNALIGLVIVLTAYLFLYVINPDLVGGTLTAPEEIVDNIDISSVSNGVINRFLDNGTLCNDGSGDATIPSCVYCKSCDTYSDLTPDCSWIDGGGQRICGVDPEITASKTAEPDAIGCCEYNHANFTGKDCQAGIAKSDCEAKSGSPTFRAGVSYTCVDAVGLGTGDECAGSAGSAPPTLPTLP